MSNVSIDYLARQRLDGRGIVIFGVGAGIGGAVAEALAQAGARLLCVDNRQAVATEVAQRFGGEAMVADVSSRADVTAVFDRAEALFGDDFYGAVNVVGVTLPGMVSTYEEDRLQAQFDLALRPAILVSQIGGTRLAKRGRGSVVLISSLAAHVATARVAFYGVAKAAVNKLTIDCAAEFGPSGVRFNAVAPGRIRASGTVPVDPETWKRIEDVVPLRRAGVPADIAGAVLFLMSDLAGYVTGAIIPTDGGIGLVSALPSSVPVPPVNG